ncbi:MAG: type IV pili methyl-accepting chemotaxis transducer N-terminal domain-containing protein [Verrucomicrobia bacterium]|nr:type IV pili methyl-accepting chemotaxis transducer N-terminal domain-containing protein [Verrucomicrobiota bacterium]
MSTPLPDSSSQRGTRSYLGLLGLLMGLVVLILGAVFVLAYQAAQRSSQYAAAVNLAGRQRMLSQRLTKGLYELQSAVEEGSSILAPQDEVRRSSELFDQTLNAFSDGSQVRGTDNAMVQLPRVALPEGVKALSRAHEIWSPLSEKVKTVLTPNVTLPAITAVSSYATDVNLTLLAQMDQLTTAVQRELALKDRTTNLLLAVGGGLFFVLIGAGFFLLFRRVKAGEKDVQEFTDRLTASNAQLTASSLNLAAAKEDTDLILTTVRQGMLLVDAQFRIGAQYSTELTRLLHLDDLSGMNFLSVLQRLLPERMFLTARDYLNLLFDPTKKEKQLLKINPLSQIEVSFPNQNGGFENYFFEFAFRRILKDKKVDRLFISIRDVTSQVRLEMRLRAEEAKKERQFEILLSILHVDRPALQEFLQLSRKELERVNDTFKMEDLARAQGTGGVPEVSLREKLRGVYAAIHNVKGNAAALSLTHFEKTAHEFEGEVKKLLDRPQLAGEDLLSVVVRQSEFRQALDEAGELADRLGTLGPQARPGGVTAAAPADPVLGVVSSFAQATALRAGRRVKVDASEFRSADLPESHRGVVRDLLLQLVRNSIVHGIEEPSRRTATHKPAEALICISGRREDRGGDATFRLHFADDGAGLDFPRIRARAVEAGLATKEQVEAMSNDEVTGFIFASGLSTAQETSVDAGRGAGLDLVRRRVMDDLGGEIEVACEPGRSLAFTLSFPLQPVGLPA